MDSVLGYNTKDLTALVSSCVDGDMRSQSLAIITWYRITVFIGLQIESSKTNWRYASTQHFEALVLIFRAACFTARRVQRKRFSCYKLTAIGSFLLRQKNSSHWTCAHGEEKRLGQSYLVRSLDILSSIIYTSQARTRVLFRIGIDSFRFIKDLSMSRAFSLKTARGAYWQVHGLLQLLCQVYRKGSYFPDTIKCGFVQTALAKELR